MNLNRLIYFQTLGETGNMRKASEMLNLSPPAISKAMKILEEEVGVSLWVRSGRNIHLTDAGKRLLKRVPALIGELNDLKNFLTDNSSGPKPVRIGTFEVFSTYFLSFLHTLKWQDTPLEMHEFLPGEIEKYLESGDVDLGITYMPVPNPNLDFLKVASIEMGVFTRVDAFKGVPQIELPYVVPVSPLQTIPTKIRGLDGWPEDAYQRKILHKVTLLETALELCRQGRVAGYFPTFIAKEHNKRVKEEFRLERRRSPYAGRICTCDVYIVKRKSDEEGQIAKQIAKAIRLICT